MHFVSFYCSVAKSCPTLCDPMDCTTPGFPVLLCLPEFAQTHVHSFGDAIQPSYPLASSSPPVLNLSQCQGVFPWVSRLFASAGQNIGASASASVLLMNIQGWFPLGLTGLIFLLSEGLSRVFQHHNSKASILWCSAFLMVQLSHPYMTTGKTIALTIWTFAGKWCLCFLINTLSRFVIAFLPKSKNLFISWLQSPSAVIL